MKKEETYPMNAPNARLSDLCILVVDDDKDTREILRFILEREAAQVIAVSTVEEAVEEYKRLSPDVVLADIGMPQANGYALISLIRAHDKPSGRSAPVIALTGYTSSADRLTAFAAGFQRYISKPFDPADIIEAIVASTGKGP
jgi:CheY-like chemotaxis protein